MAYTPPPGSGTSGGRNGNGNGTVVKERVKSIGYSATVNKLLLDVEADTTEGSVKEGTLGDLRIKNTGNHPAFAILAYRLWTDATTMSGNTYHLNCLLKPGEEIIKEMGDLWDIIKTLLEGEKQKKIDEDLAKQIKEMEDEDYSETKLSPTDALTARQKKIIWRSVVPDASQSNRYKEDRDAMLPEINKLRRKINL